MAELSLLNVGTGDTKISFDEEASPEQLKNAAAAVNDMIRRGYVVLVEVGKDEKGPLYRRALEFDGETNEYIVAGLPEDLLENPKEEVPREPRTRVKTGKRAPAKRRVSARKAGAVAVPRTAGG